MDNSRLSKKQKMELTSAARTTVGDQLRSLTYFTEDEVEQLYLRDELDHTANLAGFAENERLGFRSQLAYKGTQLGQYQFTIRVFERGYLTRVIDEKQGVWVTTDEMGISRFEELANALASVLRGF